MASAETVSVKPFSRKRWLKGALFFLLIVLPCFIIAYYSYMSLREQLTESILERKTTIASQTATIVHERLTHITQLGNTYASKSHVRELVEDGKWQEAIKQLKEIALYSQEIDRIFLTDHTGTLQADFPELKDARNKNFSHLDWYQGLVRSNWQPYVSNVYRRLLAPHFIVTNASFPIRNQKGQAIGILVIQLHPELFKTWRKLQQLETNEKLYIVDKTGQIVSSPGLILNDSLINYAQLPALKKALAGQQGIEEVFDSVSQETMLTAYAPVSDYDWAVILEQPYSTVFAKRNQSLVSVLVVFSGIFLASIFFAWLVIHNISKLRRTRESLRESEERYALALEGTNAGLWDWNLRTNELFFSPQWKSKLGYTETEFPNTFDTWESKLPPEDWEKTMNIIQDYFQKKIPVYETEFRMRHKDGSYRWILARGQALWDQDGKPYRMVGSLTDLTERNRLEESLRISEERYALALKGTNDGLWDWDLRTNDVFFSARWKGMLGYSETELTNHLDTWKNLLHPNDTEPTMVTLQAYLDKKSPVYEAEFRMRHKDGTYRWILARGMALWDKEEKPYRMIGSHTDITVRKQLEEERLQAQNFLKSIVDNMPIMLFVKDAKELRFVRWNKGAEDITGLPEEEMLGKNDHDFFPKEQADFFNGIDREVLRKGEFKEIEEEKIETRYKGTRTLNTKKIPIFDLEGKPIYLLGISEDITEKKKAEAKILELNNTLAVQVKQLEKINQELKDVTHIISHDLKAPLRGIEMVTEWILTDCMREIDDNCRANILAVSQRVKRLHNLIEGILRYAQIGRTAGEKEELDLNSLIPEIVDLISPPANIKVTLANVLPVVIAEKAPVQQIFQNLISNAVKYNDKPEGIIKVGATETENFWQFYVSDNGPGIEKEYFQRIFQLFQTLQARDEFESTGIGLTIVKKIVENFGGRIWLESEPGEGTTFFFSLPKSIVKPV